MIFMLKHKLFYSFALLLLFSGCSDDVPEKPYVRKPMSITIEKNGAWDGFTKTAETAEDCKQFVLNKQDINEYFMVALEASESVYASSQLKSRCYTEGMLTLPRGYKGKWRINKSRYGVLMVENDQAYFFYCDQCVSRNYAERR